MVTHTAVGFKGTVRQDAEARRMARLGPRFTVASAADWSITPTSADRTVSIAAGSGQACGVIDTTITAETLQLPANTSGQTRYDLIINRFKWTDPVTDPIFTYVLGTPGAGVPNADGLIRTPGTQYDGLLAVARVASGQGALSGNDVFDYRLWGGGTSLIASTSSLPTYLDVDLGQEVVVAANGVRRRWNGTEWGEAANNAGTTGVLAGTAPPLGTRLLTKTFYANVVLNGNGDGTINFPGGAFPNGLLSLQVSHYTSVAPSNNIEFVPWGATLATTNVRCYFGTAIFGGTGVACILTAIGW